jgi:hypothetical protein
VTSPNRPLDPLRNGTSILSPHAQKEAIRAVFVGQAEPHDRDRLRLFDKGGQGYRLLKEVVHELGEQGFKDRVIATLRHPHTPLGLDPFVWDVAPALGAQALADQIAHDPVAAFGCAHTPGFEALEAPMSDPSVYTLLKTTPVKVHDVEGYWLGQKNDGMYGPKDRPERVPSLLTALYEMAHFPERNNTAHVRSAWAHLYQRIEHENVRCESSQKQAPFGSTTPPQKRTTFRP